MAGIKNSQTPFYNFLNSPKFRIWRHLCFILAIVFISLNYAFSIEGLRLLWNHTFIVYLITLVLSYLLTAYFNFYFLIPRYLLKKRYLPYIVYLSLSICLLLITQFHLERLFQVLLGATITNPTYNFDDSILFTLDLLANFFLNLIAFVGCSVTILLKHWMNENQHVNQLERQHLQAEVEHLKEQVNPDFLFNSLHQIATLEENDARQASAMLMSLSHLLRYQLYDCNHEQVFLASEIQYLTHYLNLEQLYCNNIRFTITTHGNINRILVPPLIFIPFVQRVVDEIKNRRVDTNIHLHFQSDDEAICFTCNGDMNHNMNTDTQLRNPDNHSLQKIEQRLHLLFGDDYQLEIPPPSTHAYAISLQLKL